MKVRKPITLWDKMYDAITDLEFDEPKDLETDAEVVDRLIELAHHYRIECNKLEEAIEELIYNKKEESIELIRFVRTSDKMGKSVEDLYYEFKNK